MGEGAERREVEAGDGAGGLEVLEALALLCSALARLFSYPTREEAALYLGEESTLYLAALASDARIEDESLYEREDCCLRADTVEEVDRVHDIRVEYTRLFFAPCAPVPLEGRRWVKHGPLSPERELGETASVARCYRESGLKLRDGVSARADSLSTELDFAAYLLQKEASYGEEGNGAQALAWKRRRTTFATVHLVPLAQAVADRVARQAVSPHVRYWAELLRRTAARCAW